MLGSRPVILQCRDGFPDDPRFDWLYDNSGGKGVAVQASDLPCMPNRLGQIYGFAGGLNPENVASTVEALTIRAEYGAIYWIDMETGVRNEAGKFSVKRCRRVCEAVFGAKR